MIFNKRRKVGLEKEIDLIISYSHYPPWENPWLSFFQREVKSGVSSTPSLCFRPFLPFTIYK